MDSDMIANNQFLAKFYTIQLRIHQCCRTKGSVLPDEGTELTISRSEFFSADFSCPVYDLKTETFTSLTLASLIFQQLF